MMRDCFIAGLLELISMDVAPAEQAAAADPAALRASGRQARMAFGGNEIRVENISPVLAC